jgi:two-component system chemotaxis sensor kinase CheA
LANAAGETREHRFVIPQANLLELVRLEGEKGRKQIERVHGAEVYRRRGKLLPLVYLSEVLGLSRGRSNAGRGQDGSDEDTVMNIVVVQAEDTAFGLVVDDVNDTQEIVVKALGKQLKALTCYLGATIMGDGKIALIVDVAGLARLANILSLKLEGIKAEIRSEDGNADGSQMLLLFRTGKFSRLVLPLSLVARLEEIPSSRVEHAGGAPVLHYRETIMPLLSLNNLLDPGSPNTPLDSEYLQVIVFREGERYIGVVVDEILDIVDETVTIKSAGSTFGLLGSGVVGGKVTDFMDLGALLKGFAGATSECPQADPVRVQKLLLVSHSRLASGAMRGYLEIRGHQVTEASSLDDALKALEHTPIDLVLTALDLGDQDGAELLDAIRSRHSFDSLPVVALLEETGLWQGSTPMGRKFNHCITRDDRGAILRYLDAIGDPSVITEENAVGNWQ